MPNNLIKTWDDIAPNWDKWKAPLRPSPEDIQIIQDSLIKWHNKFVEDANGITQGKRKAFLLGVTPEIASMRFPFNTTLTAVDKSENMVKHVWPGDIVRRREATVDDWFTMRVEPKSQDIVLADGSFVFFNPTEMHQLARIVMNMLKPEGVFILRQFIAPAKQETLDDIIADLKAGKIENFHSYKFRVAMALQKNSTEGVYQNEIWGTIVNLMRHGNKNFPRSDLETGRIYRGKFDKLYFPTLDEFKPIIAKYLNNVEVVYPTYEFGNCCPTFIASAKPIS